MSAHATSHAAGKAGQAAAPPVALPERSRSYGRHTDDTESCTSCRSGGGLIQRCAENGDPGCACGVDEALHMPGQPLESDVRSEMGRRFGTDFSRVRVHTDTGAAATAARLNARAYTVGNDIVFGAGRYAPRSTEGRRLLAHELTHVVQQSRGPVEAGARGVSSPSSPVEHEAHAVADRVLGGQDVRGPLTRAPGRQIARDAGPSAGTGRAAGNKGQRPTGGLTFSPRSRISAQQFLQMIQNNQKMADWMKSVFSVQGNRLLVKRQFRLPPGVQQKDIPKWFMSALVAIESGNWHFTTGMASVSPRAGFPNEKLQGDWEPGDAPVAGPRTGGMTGETIEARQSGGYGRGMLDDRAGGDADNPQLRRRATDKKPAQGLIVVADRFGYTTDPAKPEPAKEKRRSDDAILTTAFHELAGHAGRISEGLSSDHGPTGGHPPITETDELSNSAEDFFAKSDETPVVEAVKRRLRPYGTGSERPADQNLDRACGTASEKKPRPDEAADRTAGRGVRRPADRDQGRAPDALARTVKTPPVRAWTGGVLS